MLKFSMNGVRFIKSFSKGQITIPKQLRETIGLGNDFWLKVYVDQGKIIAEPVEKVKDKMSYAKQLLSIKGGWLDLKEIARNRKQIEQQIRKRSL